MDVVVVVSRVCHRLDGGSGSRVGVGGVVDNLAAAVVVEVIESRVCDTLKGIDCSKRTRRVESTRSHGV